MADVVFLDVLPRMDRFGPQVAKGAGKAGAQGGKSFKDAYEKTGKVDVRKLTGALSTARAKEADAAGRVRVAEARLAEVRDTAKVKASALARAEESLAAAQRKLVGSKDTTAAATKALADTQAQAARVLEDSGRKSGRRFGIGLRKGVDGRAVGRDVGSRFGGGFTGALGGVASRSSALLAGAFAGLSVGAFLKDSITAASDLGETVSKTRQIFGPAAGDIIKFSETSATALGQSQRAALDANATFGIFGKSAGLQGKNLSGFTTELTTLAGDLASFNNTSPEQAIEAIGAALRGESEPIRSYGVLLDDASLRQEALAKGLIKTTKQALTPQQRLLAAQALILKQTGTAQGDFARTSGGLANQQRQLSAQFDNLKSSLGEIALPLVTELATVANKEVVPAIAEFVQGMKDGSGAGGEFADGLRGALEAGKDIAGTLVSTAGFVKDNRLAFESLTVAVGAAYAVTKLHSAVLAVQAAGGLVGYAKGTRAITAATKTWTAAQWLLNIALRANPIGLVITGLTLLGTAVVVAYKKSETFRKVVDTAWGGIKTAFATGVRAVVGFMVDFATFILEGADKAFGWIPGLGGKIDTAKKELERFRDATNRAMDGIQDKEVKVTATVEDTVNKLVKAGYSDAEARKELRIGLATGGPVAGAGSGTSDSIPAWLSNGEHVWTAKEVRNAGGHAAIEAMRQQFRFARGGPVDFDLTAKVPSSKDLGSLADRLSKRMDRFAALIEAAASLGLTKMAAAFAPVGPGSLGSGAFRRPVAGYSVSSEYGMRTNPVTGKYRLHDGIDLAARSGTPVYAAAAGQVSSAGWSGGYGNYVTINHAGGVRTGYAHLSSIRARSGANVGAGALIGAVGSTGNSTGPHLHHNYKQGGTFINPRRFARFHDGGVVGGRGEQPILALGGEGVLSHRAMERIGGPRVVESLNDRTAPAPVRSGPVVEIGQMVTADPDAAARALTRRFSDALAATNLAAAVGR